MSLHWCLSTGDVPTTSVVHQRDGEERGGPRVGGRVAASLERFRYRAVRGAEMTVLDDSDLLALIAAGPARQRAQLLAAVASVSTTHYAAVCTLLCDLLGVARRTANPNRRTLARILLEYIDRTSRELDAAQPYASELIADWSAALRLPRLLVGYSFAEEAQTLFRSRRKKMTATEKKALAHSLCFLVGDVPLRAVRSFPSRERAPIVDARRAWEHLQEMFACGKPAHHRDCKRLRKLADGGRKASVVRTHLEREGCGNETPVLRATNTSSLFYWQANHTYLSHAPVYDQLPLLERVFWHTRLLEDWDSVMQQLPVGSEVLVLAQHALDCFPEWDRYAEYARVRSYVWAVRVPH